MTSSTAAIKADITATWNGDGYDLSNTGRSVKPGRSVEVASFLKEHGRRAGAVTTGQGWAILGGNTKGHRATSGRAMRTMEGLAYFAAYADSQGVTVLLERSQPLFLDRAWTEKLLS